MADRAAIRRQIIYRVCRCCVGEGRGGEGMGGKERRVEGREWEGGRNGRGVEGMEGEGRGWKGNKEE